jgi:hypothetical protein
MERVERYLDEVCGPLGGSAEQRSQIREELRTHLLEAIGCHRSDGMPEDAAIDAAIGELGPPADVRAELEAVHGHRSLSGRERDIPAGGPKGLGTARWAMTAAGIAGAILLVEALLVGVSLKLLLPRLVQMLAELDAEVPGHFVRVLRVANFLMWGPGILVLPMLALFLGAWVVVEFAGPPKVRAVFRVLVMAAAAALTVAVVLAGVSTGLILHGLPG